MDGVAKVVKAPSGSVVTVFKGEVRESRQPGAAPIRLVNNPEAPGYRLIDQDTTYPYRQKELIEVVNGMLPEGTEINSYDVLCLRRIFGVDENPRFFHYPKFASPQYSDEFAKWLVEKHKKDSGFFEKARDQNYQLNHNVSS